MVLCAFPDKESGKAGGGSPESPPPPQPDSLIPFDASSDGPGSAPRSIRRYTLEERHRFLEELDHSGESIRAFSKRTGIPEWAIYAWRRAAREGSPSHAHPATPGDSSSSRKIRLAYGADQRRQAVEAFQKSGMTQHAFARLYGVARYSLAKWLLLHKQHGPKGLEDKKRGRVKGCEGNFKRLPQTTRDAIAQTRRQFPDFGMRKIRDFLYRFGGIQVSAGGVRSTLLSSGEAPLAVTPRRRPRKQEQPRRFERAKPCELWQSDITSFVLTRHKQRVYLTVFMDDHSRYVVSHGLHTHQKQELVTEALLDGIARFGKPLEILTDQGRQYFAWRGKSDFQRLLTREGIQHVVARAHHPQTVGKCERFWETVNAEFWDRCHPQDLNEARERLAHFINHYNHFRPHQGLDGLVPADRFFGAEQTLRQTIEQSLSNQEIQLALADKERTRVYFCGQIGDQRVSLHGEKGRIVFQTPEGNCTELNLEELGVQQRKEIHGDANTFNRKSNTISAVDASRSCAAAAAPLPQANPAEACTQNVLAGECAMGGGFAGGTTSCAQTVHGNAGAVAGQNQQAGGERSPGDPAAAHLAVVAAGACGHDGGTPEAATQPTAWTTGAGESGEQYRRTSSPAGAEGEGTAGACGPGCAAAAVAFEPTQVESGIDPRSAIEGGEECSRQERRHPSQSPAKVWHPESTEKSSTGT